MAMSPPHTATTITSPVIGHFTPGPSTSNSFAMGPPPPSPSLQQVPPSPFLPFHFQQQQQQQPQPHHQVLLQQGEGAIDATNDYASVLSSSSSYTNLYAPSTTTTSGSEASASGYVFVESVSGDGSVTGSGSGSATQYGPEHPYATQQLQQQQQQQQQSQHPPPPHFSHSFGSTSFHQIQHQNNNGQPLSPTSFTSASPGLTSVITSTSPGMTTTTNQSSWGMGESPDKHSGIVVGYPQHQHQHPAHQHLHHQQHPPLSTSMASSSSQGAHGHGLYALPDLTSKVYWPSQELRVERMVVGGGAGEGYDQQQQQQQQQQHRHPSMQQVPPGQQAQQKQQRHIRQQSMSAAGMAAAEAATAASASSAASSSSKHQIGLADILADGFYEEAILRRRGSLAPSMTGGPQLLHSPSGVGQGHTPPPPGFFGGDEDETGAQHLSREDPLATQVWKLYARTKATLPHAQRMENLTWRMMAMALRKRREGGNGAGIGMMRSPASGNEVVMAGLDANANLGEATDVERMAEEAAARALVLAGSEEDVKALTVDGGGQFRSKVAVAVSVSTPPTAAMTTTTTTTTAAAASATGSASLEKERGRNIDKGRKPKMRVEGFHTGQGGEEDEEFADVMEWRAASRSRSRAPGAMEWRAASQSRSRSRPPMALGLGAMNMAFQHGGAPAGMIGHSSPGLSTGYPNGGSLGPSGVFRPGGVRDPVMWIPQTFEESPPAVQEGTSHSSAIAIPNASQGSQRQLEDESGGNIAGVDRNEEKDVDVEVMAMSSGSGSVGPGVSLLTKGLQMFSESPPSAGVDFFRGHFNRPGSAIVGQHVTLSQSLRDKGVQYDGAR
ncbi:hypothetical protein FRC17_005951, partial [Serendipita sp. 399]